MYIYLLLSICTFTVASLTDRGLWDLLEDVINMTHDTYVPEDARLTINQLAEKYHYPFEEHTVCTADGYHIKFHRIPNVHGSKKPVVFLMHGILESSDSWVLLGPEKALAYVLADKGFDVWMGNTRGNKYALTHINLTHTMTKFWEFSWEEIAMNDLPAMIDYILKLTGKENLYYIGHSQGTTSAYVLCSMKPEYNSKINTVFSLAPEAWMGNVKSPIVRMFSPAHNVLGYLLKDLNKYSAGIDFFNKISAFICSILPGRCDNLLFAMSGYETKVNETFLSVILGHMPTGASTLQFVHYGQLVESKRFCRYDYGKEINMKKYGQETPPDYDLSKATASMVLFYSGKDWLSDPRDVDKLKRRLPNVQGYFYLNDFTHIDYVYAADAVYAIYNKIIDHINTLEDMSGIDVRPAAVSRHQIERSSLREVPKFWC